MPDRRFDEAKDEFSKFFSEFYGSVIDAWTAGFRHWQGTLGTNAPTWMNPSAATQLVNSASLALRFRDMVDTAFRDLPLSALPIQYAEKIREIQVKWKHPYEKLIREMFGMPSPSAIDVLTEQWRSMFGLFAPAPKVFPDFSGMSPVMDWLLPRDFGIGGLWPRFWKELYGNYFRGLPSFPGGLLTPGFHQSLKKVVDAQVLWLNTVAELQQRIVSTSGKALERIMRVVAGWERTEATAETYRTFCRTWLSATEDAYTEFFASKEFYEAVGRSIKVGLDAQLTMVSAMEEALALGNVLGHKGTPQEHESFEDMKEQIRNLQKELELIRSRIEA